MLVRGFTSATESDSSFALGRGGQHEWRSHTRTICAHAWYNRVTAPFVLEDPGDAGHDAGFIFKKKPTRRRTGSPRRRGRAPRLAKAATEAGPKKARIHQLEDNHVYRCASWRQQLLRLHARRYQAEKLTKAVP